MTYGARAHFQPPLRTFGDAVYEAGGALLTIGLSPHYPAGLGRWIELGAGFCGLAVITMAVTYLLEVQSSITRRDIGIIKLEYLGGRSSVGADPARAIRGDPQPRCPPGGPQRSAELVRDRQAEPHGASLADLFPVGRDRRRLACSARRPARSRPARRASDRRRPAVRPSRPAARGRASDGARALRGISGSISGRGQDEQGLAQVAQRLETAAIQCASSRTCQRWLSSAATIWVWSMRWRISGPPLDGLDPARLNRATRRRRASAPTPAHGRRSCRCRRSGAPVERVEKRPFSANQSRRIAGAAAFMTRWIGSLVWRSSASSTSSTDRPRP